MRTFLAALIAAWSSAATSVAAGDEPLAFVRIDQTGSLGRGDLASAYSLESARAVVPLEGSVDRGLYRGATHRLAASYGVLEWLCLGVEQSVKQETPGNLKLGLLAPIVRVRLDRLGAPLPGVGVYAQGRIRVTGRRPDSVIAGVAFDRELGVALIAALFGYERAVDGTENGFRAEAGVSLRLPSFWRLAAETWGHLEQTPAGREGSFHAGPSLQRRFGPVRVGAQLGVGLESRVAMTAVDAVGLIRVALGF